jgi:prepilin-type processing-associated H-X9-DG protein
MDMKTSADRSSGRRRAAGAFTLIELLLVIGIIAVLTMLLLPALSRGKAQAQATACRNHLRQIGLTLTMYLSDSPHYPPMWDTSTSQLWVDKLYPNDGGSWTNLSWNCPTYVGNKGVVGFITADQIGISYAYNWRGTATGWQGRPRGRLPPQLGLGHLSRDETREPEVLVPSEMYAVADARPIAEKDRIEGNPKMVLYKFATSEEAPAPHSQRYCVLFADGHAGLVKRADYLYPPRTAHNWNRDNQPHPETWAPPDQWAVAK